MKNLLSLMLLLIIPVGIAFANGHSTMYKNNYGGFYGTNMAVSTVSQAVRLSNNSYVTLQGFIAKRYSDDRYLFKDDTGSITVEIDDDKWMGQTVVPTDKVEISGKIDKDMFSVKIDVKRIKKLTK